MTGSFGEMGNLLKQAQQMQKAMDAAREELKTTILEGSAGGGVVRVQVCGDGRVEKVEIADEVVRATDRALLEDLVLAALKDGLAKAERLRTERLSSVTGGLNLPGMF